MAGAASTKKPGPENRLAHETSPYLLQHKHNPVDWRPWGPEALDEARAQNKPILLSVGYAACHWCHVMAHESFEDDATAQVMNELFVNIKVDREERPDIDQIYMQALHHLGEQGGWPLTMFLTPAGEPFWGGTYFPPTSRYGRPAFVDVLREVARLFREEPAKIEQNRAALMTRLAEVARHPHRVTVGRQELDQVGEQLGTAMDPVNGGLRGAPKFPQSAMFENLWRAGLRTGEGRFFSIVDLTLTRISEGGIYDHLGGGYSALFGRRQMAGAAFREDALRQCPASRSAGAGLGPDRKDAVPGTRRRDCGLARAGDDQRGRRILLLAGRGLLKAKRESSTSGRWPKSRPY